jgi:hypothetical protein
LACGPGRGGEAQAEQADHDEVQRAQVRQLVPADRQIGGLGKQFAKSLDIEVLPPPGSP